MARLAERAYVPGDPLPAVGSTCMVSGANSDITCDQDRGYLERQVIGYTPCGNFVCFQTRDCWPTVERLTNCWFAAIAHAEAAAVESSVPESGLISRKQVTDMLNRVANEHADLAIYGEPENARVREGIEAALNRAKHAVVFMDAYPTPITTAPKDSAP